MTDIPVVVSDSDDGTAIIATLVVLLGVPGTDRVFPVAFDRFQEAVGPGLPDFLQSQVQVLHSRAGELYWEGINEVPDTPGEQSAIGHALQVRGTGDQDYHWAEIIDAVARAAAQAAQDTGASNLQLIQALQSGKLDVSAAFTQALADARYERIGEGGGTAVAPELVGFSDVSLAANANEVALAVRTDVTRTGAIVLSVSAGGVRLKAGSYMLTFMGVVDATGERFNPQFLVNDAVGPEGLTAPTYYRGTGGEQATIWMTPLLLSQDTDFTFSARQGQYSSSEGVGGAGTVSGLRLMIQPVGGIKGEPGRDGAPGPAVSVGDDLPWSTITLSPSGIDTADFPSNFYLEIADKLTDKTCNQITLSIGGARVLQLLSSDTNFSDLFGQLNGAVNGGAVFRFSFIQSVKDNIISSLSSDHYTVDVDVGFVFTDGSTGSYRLYLFADDAVFARDKLSDSVPQAPGTAAAGSSEEVARADHVHPPSQAARPGGYRAITANAGGNYVLTAGEFAVCVVLVEDSERYLMQIPLIDISTSAQTYTLDTFNPAQPADSKSVKMLVSKDSAGTALSISTRGATAGTSIGAVYGVR